MLFVDGVELQRRLDLRGLQEKRAIEPTVAAESVEHLFEAFEGADFGVAAAAVKASSRKAAGPRLSGASCL